MFRGFFLFEVFFPKKIRPKSHDFVSDYTMRRAFLEHAFLKVTHEGINQKAAREKGCLLTSKRHEFSFCFESFAHAISDLYSYFLRQIATCTNFCKDLHHSAL